jgi:hypothetical protein
MNAKCRHWAKKRESVIMWCGSPTKTLILIPCPNEEGIKIRDLFNKAHGNRARPNLAFKWSFHSVLSLK